MAKSLYLRGVRLSDEEEERVKNGDRSLLETLPAELVPVTPGETSIPGTGADGALDVNGVGVTSLSFPSESVSIAGGVATWIPDSLAAGQEVLATANIARSGLAAFVTQRDTHADPPANFATWAGSTWTATAGQSDPLGGTAAYLIAATAAGENSYLPRGTCTGLTDDGEWVFEGYVKAGTTNWIVLWLGNGALQITYNLATGKTLAGVSATTANAAGLRSFSCIAAGNGWYKITVRHHPIGSANPYVYVGPGKSDTGAFSYTQSGETICAFSFTYRRPNVQVQVDIGTAATTIEQATPANAPPYDSTGWSFDDAGAVRWIGSAHGLTNTGLATLLSGAAKPFTLIWLLDLWTVPAANAYLIRATGATANLGIELLPTGQLRVSRTNDAGATVTTATTAAVKRIPQVVTVRYDGSQFTLFIDGVSVAISAHASTVGAATYTAGTWGGAVDFIDAEARVFDAALTSTEVLNASKALARSRAYSLDEPWSVILCVGQSNMVEGSPAIDDFTGDAVRFNSARRFVDSSAGTAVALDKYAAHPVPPGTTGTVLGVDAFMMRKLGKMGKKRIVALKYARNGIGIFSMVPTWLGNPNAFYTDMIASFNAMLPQLPTNHQIRALVFTGTETDASIQTAAEAVSANLQLLRSSVMASMGLASLEMVYNLLSSGVSAAPGYTYVNTVRAQGVAAAAANSHLHYHDPSAFELSAVDNLHYTLNGKRSLGEQHAVFVSPYV